MPVQQAVGEEIFVKLFDGIIKKKKSHIQFGGENEVFKTFQGLHRGHSS